MEILYVCCMGLMKLWKGFMYCIRYCIQPYIKGFAIAKMKKAGVRVNGTGPQDIRVHNEGFYLRLGHDKTLGLGESYMDGWWDCDRLDEFFTRILGAGLYKTLMMLPSDHFFHYLQFDVFNLQTAKRSWEVAEKHYNLGMNIYFDFFNLSYSLSSPVMYKFDMKQVTSYSDPSWTHQ